ncbi:hypothetical protein NECAME_01945 [Necator americanus]|uniref:Uncharacterized protein n=1 Tax=Necator americanus TaxID=51031 RepID=W2TKN5_NECAM|nr:hypothetical protein NECAME_01945 [Necator americanus]ETN82660.1 hypothetical protein NECAME_01945 [Necator americanus]
MMFFVLISILIVIQGNSRRDCNVFSSEIRKCSQNVTRPINKETGPSSITIYDKNGVVVLRWNISTEPEAQNRASSMVSASKCLVELSTTSFVYDRFLLVHEEGIRFF